MRHLRVFLLLSAVVLCAVVSPTADAKCPRTQDGYVVCNAICQYPANCVAGGSGYCYKDIVVNACFDGGYEECCNTAGLF